MSFGNVLKVGAVVGVVVGLGYYLNKKGKEAVTYFKTLEVEGGQKLERQLNHVKRFSAVAGYQMDEFDLAVISEAERTLAGTHDLIAFEALTVRLSAIMDKIAAAAERPIE